MIHMKTIQNDDSMLTQVVMWVFIVFETWVDLLQVE